MSDDTGNPIKTGECLYCHSQTYGTALFAAAAVASHSWVFGPFFAAISLSYIILNALLEDGDYQVMPDPSTHAPDTEAQP